MSIPRKQRGTIYQQLPDKLQDFFTDRELTEHLIQLGDTYGLSQDDRNTLGEEVGLIILGINPSSDLKNRLQNRLSIHNDAAVKIATSVKKYIPTDIKQKIQNLPDPKTLLNENENVGQTDGADIPVPPPPGSKNADIPTPEYGGNSDPYREPTD